MTEATIIEVSDICIRAIQAGNQAYAEPGIALLPVGGTPVLGHAAQKLLRQQPTRIHSRFWSELSTEPLPINNSSVRHGADLVWQQLAQLKEHVGAVPISLCIPSNLSHQQMQLLTGICGSLQLNVSYLINLGLAQLAVHKPTEAVVHLDLQLHQLVVSRYQLIEGQLSLYSQEAVQSIGFLRIVDRFLHVLSDKFIQSTRFDPLHSGDTEQQLFDQILMLLESGSLRAFEINTAQQSHRIEPTAQDFQPIMQALKADLDRLLDTSDNLAYAPVFSKLPGFWPESNGIALLTDDVVQGAEQLIGQQNSTADETIYINKMAVQNTAINSAVSTDKIAETISANGLLFKGIVYSEGSFALLDKTGFPADYLGFDQGTLISTKDALRVNQSSSLAGSKLAAGDALDIQGITATAVHCLGQQ